MNSVILLSQLGIIKATGLDAANFLNGQLSTNILDLNEPDVKLAAYCSPQGKMLASFMVLKTAPEEFLLIGSADLIPAMIKRLSMYIMRAKVQLSDFSGQLSLYGLVNPHGLDDGPFTPWTYTRSRTGFCIALPEVPHVQRYICIAPSEQLAPQPDQPALSQDAWDWLSVNSGIVMVTQAIHDTYIPQMLNYESLGAIDFAKGCYPGQEVVSRSQFRGTLKRRLHLLRSEQQLLAAGMEVFTQEESVGEIVMAAPSPQGGWSALAVLRIDAVQTPLTAASPTGPALALWPLPYPLRNDF